MSEIERKKHWMAMIAEATIIFQDMKIVEYVAFLEAENKRLNEEKIAWHSVNHIVAALDRNKFEVKECDKIPTDNGITFIKRK